MVTFLVEEVVNAAAGRWAGRVVVGRGVAGRGQGVAGGSSRVGCVVDGCGVARADRVGLAVRSARSWSPDDLDGYVRAVGGDQAAHRLGVRDVDAGGVGLDSSAAVLSDRVGGAGPG